MKANLLPIAKSAMKYFFDIDPVLTETVMVQALTHGQLIQKELRHAIRANVKHNKTRIIDLIGAEGSHSYNAA